MAGGNPDLGLSVGLIDPGKVIAELNQLKQQAEATLGQLQKEATKATSSLSQFRSEFPMLDKAITLATNPIVLFTAATAGVVVAMGKGVQAAAEFNHEFLQLQNLNPGKTTSEIGALKKEIVDMALQTGLNAKKLSTAFFDVQSLTGLFGKDAESLISTVGKFSQATTTDFNTAINQVAKGMKNFGFAASETEKFLQSNFATVAVGKTTFDELSKAQVTYSSAAAGLGQSFDDANKVFAIFSSRTKSVDEAATGAKSVFADLGKASAMTALKEKGIKVIDETTGKFRSMDDITRDMIATFKDMNQTDFLALKEKIGGSQEGIGKYLDLAKTAGDDLLATLNGFNDAGKDFNLDKLLDNAKGDFNTLKDIVGNQFNAVMIKLGEAILPNLARALNGISQIIPPIVAFFERWGPLIAEVGKYILYAAAAWGTYKAVLFATSTIQSALVKSGDLLKDVFFKTPSAITGVITQMKALWAAMIANPMTAIVAGIGLVIGALLLLKDKAHTASTSVQASIRVMRTEIEDFAKSSNEILAQTSKTLEDIRSGKDTGETFVQQLTKQLEEAKIAADKAREALVNAKRETNRLDEQSPMTRDIFGKEIPVGGSLLANEQDVKDAEKRVAELTKQLEDAMSKVKVAQKEFKVIQDVAAGLTVNSLAALNAEQNKLNDALQKVAIGSDAYFELGNKLDIVKKKIEEANKLLSDQAFLLSQQKQQALLKAEGITVSDVAPLPVPAPDFSAAEKQLTVFKDGFNNLNDAANEFGTRLKDIFAEIGKSIQQMAVQAFGSFAFGLGEAIGGARKFQDVLRELGKALLVEVPKYAGMALLNAATTAQPWPVALGLAAAGLALLGLSGFASAKFAQAEDNGAQSGINSPGQQAAAQANQDLGTFSADQFGAGPTIQIFMDSKEISNVVRHRVDIMNELQIGG